MSWLRSRLRRWLGIDDAAGTAIRADSTARAAHEMIVAHLHAKDLPPMPSVVPMSAVVPDGAAVVFEHPDNLNTDQRAYVQGLLDAWAATRGIHPLLLDGGVKLAMPPRGEGVEVSAALQAALRDSVLTVAEVRAMEDRRVPEPATNDACVRACGGTWSGRTPSGGFVTELSLEGAFKIGDMLTLRVPYGALARQPEFWVVISDPSRNVVGWLKFERRVVVNRQAVFAATEVRSASAGEAPQGFVLQGAELLAPGEL